MNPLRIKAIPYFNLPTRNLNGPRQPPYQLRRIVSVRHALTVVEPLYRQPRPPSRSEMDPFSPRMTPESATAEAKPAISSKIMGLKFMQRHASLKKPSAAEPQQSGQPRAQGSSKVQVQSAAVTEPPAEASGSRWVLPREGDASAAPKPVVVLNAPLPSGPQALLQFKPGRRSFGNFNSRLETRLQELDSQKKIAAADILIEEAAVRAREKQQAEYAELEQRANEQARACCLIGDCLVVINVTSRAAVVGGRALWFLPVLSLSTTFVGSC